MPSVVVPKKVRPIESNAIDSRASIDLPVAGSIRDTSPSFVDTNSRPGVQSGALPQRHSTDHSGGRTFGIGCGARRPVMAKLIVSIALVALCTVACSKKDEGGNASTAEE